MEFLDRVEQGLLQAFPFLPSWKGRKVLAALSGGRDSVCLLHALCHLSDKFGYVLSAVYVHHGIRLSADQDVVFCEDFCHSLRVPLTVRYVDAPRYSDENHLSLEEAARDLRYQAFAGIPCDVLCTAHYSQDQAETMLLHLFRGTGMEGLCAMKPLTKRNGLTIVRPMLKATDGELETYVKDHRLSFVSDETNEDLSYARNRIRHELLPYLQAHYNPQIVEALCRSAELLSEEEQFLEQETAKADPGPLTCSGLAILPPAIQRRVIRRKLCEAGLDANLTYSHTEAVRQLAEGTSGRQICLPGGLTVEKSYDILLIHKFPEAVLEDTPSLDGFFVCPASPEEARITGPKATQKWICADSLKTLPVWRYRREKDYITLRRQDGSMGHKTLKKYFSDEKIPKQLRSRIPLLCEGSRVLWVYGGRLSDDVKLGENTRKVIHAGRRLDAE